MPGFFSQLFGSSDAPVDPTKVGPGVGMAKPAAPDYGGFKGFGRQLKDEFTGNVPGQSNPYRGKNIFSQIGHSIKDDLTGEGDRRIARQEALKKMLGAPLPAKVPTPFEMTRVERT